MKHKIKMIGLDLDGTLLNSQKELTPYTKKVLEEALAKGIIVLAATGRPISAIPKEILQIPGMKYAVTANGARVLEIEPGNILSENMLPVETAKDALNLLSDFDTIHEFFRNGTGYTSKSIVRAYEYFENPSMAEYFINTRTVVENVLEKLIESEEPVDKVQWIFDDLSEKKEAFLRLQQIKGITITGALGNNLEINKEGVDKGSAILALGELLGIQKEEIMACGDGMNDYAMLKAVGFAVAMENGHEKLKEIADYVTVSNDEDGVAKAICKFALEND